MDATYTTPEIGTLWRQEFTENWICRDSQTRRFEAGTTLVLVDIDPSSFPGGVTFRRMTDGVEFEIEEESLHEFFSPIDL